jgi:DNA anti-recombination protein RmuC
MEDVTSTVGGFRAAIQDLLVPELKALQVEVRNVRETLERHEKWLERHDQMLAQILQEIHQGNKEQSEKLAVMSERFIALQTELHEKFAAMNERFATLQKQLNEKFTTVMEGMKELQKAVIVLTEHLNFAQRLQKLELQFTNAGKARKSKAGV